MDSEVKMKKIIGYYRKCDLLTMLGTICSFIGIILIFSQNYTLSTICMILSGVCDAFDGTLARKGKYTKSQQTYGVQLDSLSDVICFGLFPAILTSVISPGIISKIICAFYMLCGVIRLAYFNTLNITDESKKGKFIGVPITTVSIIYPLVFIIIRLINFDYLSIIMPIILFVLGISFILRVEIPKPNIVNIIKKIFNKYVVSFILFPIFITLISDLFYILNNNTIIGGFIQLIETITSNFLPFIIITLVVATITIIFNAIFKKSIISKIVILTMLLILLVVSDIKFNIMGIPLELTDINYLNPDNINMMGTATGTIGNWIIWIILKAIAVIILGGIFILIDKNNQIIINKKKYRLITAALAISVIFIFIILSNKKNEFILKNIYNTNEKELINFNTITEVYNEYGYWQGMYLNTLYKSNNKPEGYDKKEISNFLQKFNTKKSTDKWEKANVVFILSEAFSYLNNIEEITFDKELTPNINSYMEDKDKKVFDLLVPSYGGVSVNTEFEILTGGSLSFWKPGFIPYTQYYNNINGSKSPNIIKEFNNNGYETMYLTPWGETSYKSKYVYNLFGTDKTTYGNDLHGENKGMYYSDKSLMEDIYEELKDTSKNNYKFIMTATGQNHFPYNGDLYETYDIKVIDTILNKEDTNILRNYAQGLYDADKELNNLYKNIQKLDTPTIVVFYGDHLPYTVNSNGTDPYTGSFYFNTSDNDLNNLRKYTTKAVIFSNYDINIEDLSYINASYLGAYIINRMDLEISNYFKFIDEARIKIPVFNRSSIYINSNIYNYNNANIEVQDILTKYKYVQYGSFYDFIN